MDTRALTLKLRDKGAMVGCICTDPAVSDADLLAKAKGWKLDGIDMISVVTTREKYEWKCALAPPRTAPRRTACLSLACDVFSLEWRRRVPDWLRLSPLRVASFPPPLQAAQRR